MKVSNRSGLIQEHRETLLLQCLDQRYRPTRAGHQQDVILFEPARSLDDVAYRDLASVEQGIGVHGGGHLRLVQSGWRLRRPMCPFIEGRGHRFGRLGDVLSDRTP